MTNSRAQSAAFRDKTAPSSPSSLLPSVKSSEPYASVQPLRATSVQVKKDRIVVDVVLDARVSPYATEEMVALIKQAFPSIDKHACINADHASFEEVAAQTSLAHLLEHMAIDEQARRVADPNICFVGTTLCSSKREQRYRIELSFTDDLIALSVFFDCLSYLNEVVLACTHDYSTFNI